MRACAWMIRNYIQALPGFKPYRDILHKSVASQCSVSPHKRALDKTVVKTDVEWFVQDCPLGVDNGLGGVQLVCAENIEQGGSLREAGVLSFVERCWVVEKLIAVTDASGLEPTAALRRRVVCKRAHPMQRRLRAELYFTALAMQPL